MSHLDSLLDRSQVYASEQYAAGTLMSSLPAAMPKVKALILGCADPRVDPGQIFDFEPGEAVVIRNIGGRVVPGVLEELGLLGRIGEVAQVIPGGGGEFHLIVLHHTDCGITRLAGDTDKLAHYFQIPEADVPAKAILEPYAAVAVDVALLRSIPAFPGCWLLSGLVYDVATGNIEAVVPPAPIRTA